MLSVSEPKSLIVTGRLDCHRDGYGFVIPEDEKVGRDVFVPARRMGDAVHGDRVAVRLLPVSQKRKRRGRSRVSPERPEGEIIEVLSRGHEVIVGKVFCYRKELFVTPLDERHHYTIRLMDGEAELEGKIVAVSLQGRASRREREYLGRIVEVLGDPEDPEIQYKIVCHTHQIPMAFPDAVLEEAETAREPERDQVGQRMDFRGQLTITIDGETARDFDDAVAIERSAHGSFSLSVHIADVSHYVGINSRLDQEAFLRGTSVYFPDRVLPMLPPRLSSELCSLKPGCDRLALSLVMDLDGRGEVRGIHFHESVIRSKERMSYGEVKRILIDRDSQGHSPDLVERLEWMLELSEILRAKRKTRGAIDFDLPEAEIEYDVSGEILDIVRSERNEAHRIIEEFMLLANEVVATYLTGKGFPLIFRVHESPDPLKVEDFLDVARRFGHGLEQSARGEYRPLDFQKLMEAVAGKREKKFLSYLMLRSFKQARYETVNSGHFGLATQNYTHFTSPIRRYPDLVVHRVLKGAIRGETRSPELEGLYGRLPQVALQSSDRERKAVEAEREVMRGLVAAFMAERLGEEYEAFIIGVESKGFFVELLDHFVEGFVPVRTIWDDMYFFNERLHCLVGRNTRKVYRIGDLTQVRLDRVDGQRHRIDFSAVLTPRRVPPRRKK